MRSELQTLGAKVSLAERAVAMDLALVADERGRAIVAASVGDLDRQTGLAWRTGLARRTVQRALSRLEWLGVISCERPARGTRPTLWRLSCVDPDEMPPLEQLSTGTADNVQAGKASSEAHSLRATSGHHYPPP